MSDTFVCNLERLTPEQRERHEHVAASWMENIRDRQRVEDGYAFTLPADPDIAASAAEFAMYERICCPFFDFSWSVEADSGEMTFRMTGPPGTADYLEQSEVL